MIVARRARPPPKYSGNRAVSTRRADLLFARVLAPMTPVAIVICPFHVCGRHF
jgi:hypothetical protein